MYVLRWWMKSASDEEVVALGSELITHATGSAAGEVEWKDLSADDTLSVLTSRPKGGWIA